MTELQKDWFWYPPETDIEILEEYDRTQTEPPRCETCNRFHPLLAKHPSHFETAILCPECLDMWIQNDKDNWEQYWASQGVFL